MICDDSEAFGVWHLALVGPPFSMRVADLKTTVSRHHDIPHTLTHTHAEAFRQPKLNNN